MRNIFIILFTLLTVGCTKSQIDDVDISGNSGEKVSMVLRFGSLGAIKTDVLTRSTMPNVAAETRIYNMYIFLFNSSGKKIYSYYFDKDNDTGTAQECVNSSKDAWYVENPTENDSQDCSGLVKIYAPKQDGCKLFAVANIDGSMVDVSPEKLGLVQDQTDMLNMIATLNQKYIERSGYFTMSGYLTGVNLSTDPISHTMATPQNQSLCFNRLDSKIRFWFAKGDAVQTLEVTSWRVVNIPRDSYVMSKEAREAFGITTADSQKDYFDIDFRPYEDENLSTGDVGFSFYMLENALDPKSSPTSFEQRSEQNKDSENQNTDFKYANDRSAYVEVCATVIMKTDYDFNGDGEINDDDIENNATLNGNVKYIFHLGDFGSNQSGSGNDNYDVLRNNYYTYNVTVNGVKDIRTEVERWNAATPTVVEDEPGATGEVTVAMFEILECDAHYQSHVITFDADYVKPEDVTWYVRTPYSQLQNSPGKTPEGADITEGLDFKWVEFRLNEMTTENGKNVYSDNKQQYKPHRTATDRDGNSYSGRTVGYFPNMGPDGTTLSDENPTGYVDELVKMLKDNKKKRESGLENLFDDNGEIKVTAFVNEYYYDKHPLTDEATNPETGENPTWRRVLNHLEPRVMHILSDTKVSADNESKIIGSAFSIRQKAIQTIYNYKNDKLKSAWGTETVDETENKKYDYYVSAAASYSTNRTSNNTSKFNGRVNTMKEWDLVNTGSGAFVEGKSWDDYLNTTGENGSEELVDKKLRYACMTRNRDNDGDGIIDADEIRWYMASISQLSNLWLGERSVAPAARLYQRSAADKQSSDANVWRQHVLSSTATNTSTSHNSNNPQLIWAEEGSATGTLYNSYEWAHSTSDDAAHEALTSYSVRCVRNLNMDDSYSDLSEDNIPVDIVQVTDYDTDAAPTSSTTRVLFDLTFLDSGSHRYYIGENQGVVQDLVFNDEHSLENCVYERFVVAVGDVNTKTFDSINFATFNDTITTSGSSEFCPDGYRIPNQRELALMDMYIKDYMGSGFYCRTYYSFGYYGVDGIQKATEASKYGYKKSDANIHMIKGGDTATQARCVRDLQAGEQAP